MKSLTRRYLLVIAGAVITSSALGQGVFDSRGGGIFGSSTGSQRETSLDGRWFLDFELEYHSEDPDAVSERISVRADVSVLGIEVSGRFRQPAEGEFTCTRLEGSDRCENGRIVIVWPDGDLPETATFEFLVDAIDGRRAKGEATFKSDSGAIRLYSVNMRKR